MRLINADALAYEILSEYGADGGTEDVNTIYGMVINAPTIQAEPVVHCKDCRFWKNEHLCLVMSRYGSIDTKAENYCAWGERRKP